MQRTTSQPEIISKLMSLGYSYKDASWLSKRVKSKNFLKRVKNPTYKPLSRPAQKRVSLKIRKLIREGYDQAQAAAIAYAYERKSRNPILQLNPKRPHPEDHPANVEIIQVMDAHPSWDLLQALGYILRTWNEPALHSRIVRTKKNFEYLEAMYDLIKSFKKGKI